MAGPRTILTLLPGPVVRLTLRLAHGLRVVWWRTCRPRVAGVQILAFDAAGRVLLLRHSYGSGRWMTPGGGLGRAEDPVAAARRELAEETGCDLLSARVIGQVEDDLHGAVNVIYIVAGRLGGEPRADGREVLITGLFPPHALPPDMPAQQAGHLPERLAAARTMLGFSFVS